MRVLGTADAAATVSVATAPSTGKTDRAWGADFVPANSSTAVKGPATVYSASPGAGAGGGDLVRTDTKTYFIPKALQTFTYDDDGNLTADSVWDYAYDAENRLVSMQNRSEVIGTGMIASADARRLEFKYDYLGRRVRKLVYDGWNGATYSGTPITDTKYLYDGWNLIAEFNAISTLALAKIYTWGLDLTGSLAAAGGVGGLIQIHDIGATKTLLPTYDGNGNVAALLNAETGSTLTLEAAYEYDPFGNLLRCENAYAASNSFRFSTKFADAETGLVYYGLRYYSPTLGRFVNKDPIEEKGGLNLYAFVGNNAANRWDMLGQYDTLEVSENGYGTFTGAPDPIWTWVTDGQWIDQDGKGRGLKDFTKPDWIYGVTELDVLGDPFELWRNASGGGSFADSYSNPNYIDNLNAEIASMEAFAESVQVDRARNGATDTGFIVTGSVQKGGITISNKDDKVFYSGARDQIDGRWVTVTDTREFALLKTAHAWDGPSYTAPLPPLNANAYEEGVHNSLTSRHGKAMNLVIHEFAIQNMFGSVEGAATTAGGAAAKWAWVKLANKIGGWVKSATNLTLRGAGPISPAVSIYSTYEVARAQAENDFLKPMTEADRKQVEEQKIRLIVQQHAP